MQTFSVKRLKSAAVSATLVALTVLSAPAQAQTYYGETSEEQRGAKSSEDKLVDGLRILNKKCGTQITASIDWSAYGGFSEADREGRTAANIYLIAGTLVGDVLSTISQKCGSDDIFKSNVAKKIKSIALTPGKGKVNAKNPSNTYQLTNGVLAVKYNFKTVNRDDLSAVWKLI